MDPAAIAAATAALDAAYEAVRAVWNKAAAAAGRCKAARKLPWCQERTVTGLRWPYDFTQASCPQPALRSPGHRGFVAHTYGPAVSGGSSACRSLLMPLSLQRLRCALCCERRHCSRHPLASTPCVPPWRPAARRASPRRRRRCRACCRARRRRLCRAAPSARPAAASGALAAPRCAALHCCCMRGARAGQLALQHCSGEVQNADIAHWFAGRERRALRMKHGQLPVALHATAHML